MVKYTYILLLLWTQISIAQPTDVPHIPNWCYLAVADSSQQTLTASTWTQIKFPVIIDTIQWNTTPAEASPYSTFRGLHIGRYSGIVSFSLHNTSISGAAIIESKVLKNDTVIFGSHREVRIPSAGYDQLTVPFYFIVSDADTTNWTESGFLGYFTLKVYLWADVIGVSLDDIVYSNMTGLLHPTSTYLMIKWEGY